LCLSRGNFKEQIESLEPKLALSKIIVYKNLMRVKKNVKYDVQVMLQTEILPEDA